MSTLTDEDLTALLGGLATSYDVPPHGPDEVLSALADQPAAVPVVRRRWVQLSAAACVALAGALVAALAVNGTSDRAEVTPSAAKAPAAQNFQKFQSAPALTSQSGSATGGSGGTGGTTGGSTGGTALDSGARRDASVPVAGGAAGSAAVGSSSSGVSVGAAPGVAPAPAPKAAVAAPPVDAPVSDDGDSRVVKSGSIALVVKDKRVSVTLSAVQKAAKLLGGYVASSSSDESSDTPSGEVTIRVPVDRFEDLVAKVRSLDAKVRTASTSGKDVTAQYADLESRLRTLRATRERFLVILSKTRTIGEILTVQQRVDDVSGQIDRLEGARKLLASQSDLSTLTVSVSEAGDPVVKVTEKPASGLSQALRDAKDGFVTGVEAIIRHSGRAVLWVLCLVVALVVGRSAWKVARRRLV